MQIDFSNYAGKTDFARVVREGKELIKWVMKAIPKSDWRPNQFGVQVENISEGPLSSLWAEFIATDGFRIHHAVACLPILFTELTEGLHVVSFRKTVLTIEPAAEGLILPDWKKIVDKELFTLTSSDDKFPLIDGQYLQDAIPPRIERDSESVHIRYKKHNFPLLISRYNNDENFAIVMPRYQ